MANIKKYLPELVVIIIIVGLIISNIFTCYKHKRKEKDILLENENLLIKIRNDSSAVKILEETNNNCLNNNAAKVEYYENKIKSINRQIEKNKLVIDRLQQGKNDIDKQIDSINIIKIKPNDLLNFINKKY